MTATRHEPTTSARTEPESGREGRAVRKRRRAGGAQAGLEAREKMPATSQRLLASAQRTSFDPLTDVDWDAPLDPDAYGCSPEWSTLYGTTFWDQLTFEQRQALTRHEAASIAATGIWFELILQQMLVRDVYTKPVTGAEFQWGLTELADECRHSIMFARGIEKLGCPAYRPAKLLRHTARPFKAVAAGETAYAAILVAEEILDVMQRDWMRDERVEPAVRAISHIHVVEESRHMAFAREQVKAHVAGAGRVRREASALTIATTSYFIVTSLVHPHVYTNAGAETGFDADQARAAAASNALHHAKLAGACESLMAFLDDCGLLTGAARQIYRRAHML